MSGPGCNLIGDDIFNDSNHPGNAGRCVCGSSVPWCPGEPHPYVFATRHECKLNLAAKIAYEGFLVFFQADEFTSKAMKNSDTH
ncbi:hypothetical protein KQX54_015921 [Cotesia glomerata]|uniref:Uncharacterized protein n=1 Tax=Cotesia glomerata TaxID=32391 RepID=A0AAV7I1A3_COTGL|nr:hypothetical protein KQX54_015921 [Cotesia glomerata]